VLPQLSHLPLTLIPAMSMSSSLTTESSDPPSLDSLGASAPALACAPTGRVCKAASSAATSALAVVDRFLPGEAPDFLAAVALCLGPVD
jgi:hypothetical protein